MVKRSFERCRKAGPFFAGCWLLGSTTALLLCMALRGSDKTQLALTDELQEASEHSFTQADAQGFWACRMSRLDGACGSRSYVEDGQTIVHASCPSNMCCSTTYCARLGQCGRWCSTNWVFCSTAIVYDRTFSYGGNCSCGQQGGKCGGNAHCRDRLSPGGGVFCECKEGYKVNPAGNGCVEDPSSCAVGGGLGSTRCWPGVCVDGENGDPYTCRCPSDHYVARDSLGVYCTRKMCPLIGSECGVGDCIEDMGTYEGYRCNCPQNYFLDSGPKGPRCSMLPCVEFGANCKPGTCQADSAAVKGYSCKCPQGHTLEKGPGGEARCELTACGKFGKNCGVGTCIDDASDTQSYQCKCPPGFMSVKGNSGPTCEPTPCSKYGENCGVGSCVNDLSQSHGYTCKCPRGYLLAKGKAGPTCDPTACTKFGKSCGVGSCIDDASESSGYRCSCPSGYVSKVGASGPVCAERACRVFGRKCGVGDCVEDEEARNGYRCKCPPGYFALPGPDGSLCTRTPCSVYGKNCGDGRCVDDLRAAHGYRCECLPGYTMTQTADPANPSGGFAVCSRDPCSGNPCVWGTCRPKALGGGYTCVCPSGTMKVYRGGKPRCYHRLS